MTADPQETHITQQLHRLIDSGAPQPVINERMSGLIEGHNKDVARLTQAVETITGDHEMRIRYIERKLSWALAITGAIGLIITLVLVILKLAK